MLLSFQKNAHLANILLKNFTNTEKIVVFLVWLEIMAFYIYGKFDKVYVS